MQRSKANTITLSTQERVDIAAGLIAMAVSDQGKVFVTFYNKFWRVFTESKLDRTRRFSSEKEAETYAKQLIKEGKAKILVKDN